MWYGKCYELDSLKTVVYDLKGRSTLLDQVQEGNDG